MRDVVVVTVLLAATSTDSAGVVLADERQVAHTNAWVRRNGSWKTLYGHESFPATLQ